MGLLDGLFGRSLKGQLLADERYGLECLLEGEHPVLGKLRRQVCSPFLLWVERAFSGSNYVATMVFDGNCIDEFSIGPNADIQLGPVLLKPEDFPGPVTMHLDVSRGIIVRLYVGAPQHAQWKKQAIRITDWTLDPLGRNWTVKNKAVAYLDQYEGGSGDTQSEERSGVASWVNTTRHCSKEDVRWRTPAAKKSVSAAERTHACEFPKEYWQFMLASDGLMLPGLDVLPIADVQLCEIYGSEFLAFAVEGTGNLYAFLCQELRPGAKTAIVYRLDHHVAAASESAGTFRQWITEAVLKQSMCAVQEAGDPASGGKKPMNATDDISDQCQKPSDSRQPE